MFFLQIRQHADNVFSFIIVPAMRSRGIDCVRSDMITDLGQVMTNHCMSVLLSVVLGGPTFLCLKLKDNGLLSYMFI